MYDSQLGVWTSELTDSMMLKHCSEAVGPLDQRADRQHDAETLQRGSWASGPAS